MNDLTRTQRALVYAVIIICLAFTVWNIIIYPLVNQ